MGENPNNTNLSEQIVLRVRPPLRAKIQLAAAAAERTQAGMIRHILEAWFAGLRQEHSS